MKFDLQKSFEIWERTPKVLQALLAGLDENWTMHNEGEDTWSPFDIVGHLIHGERTDWMTRLDIILEHGTDKTFDTFDRLAQFEESKGKTLTELLEEFAKVRNENLERLQEMNLTEVMLNKKGMHPQFGEVTVQQLLSTWVIHDLTHIAQIGRVMAKQYKDEIGPWLEYFRIMQ